MSRMLNPIARAACGIASLLMLGVSSGAIAQEPIVWSDIDCALTKIVVPQGLRCRETNEAGTRGRATSTGIGVAKSWSAFGTVQQVKLYYHVHQVLSPRSYVHAGQFTEVLRNLSSDAKAASSMSAPTPRADADFVTFVGAKGENCVGIRKLGPSTSKGVAWTLYATRCVPRGQKPSDADIDRFIAAADFRP
jgi:hypothetical protein